MSRKWMNTWKDIGRIIFNERQKVAFQKIKILTQYNLMDRADGSIQSAKLKMRLITFKKIHKNLTKMNKKN